MNKQNTAVGSLFLEQGVGGERKHIFSLHRSRCILIQVKTMDVLHNAYWAGDIRHRDTCKLTVAVQDVPTTPPPQPMDVSAASRDTPLHIHVATNHDAANTARADAAAISQRLDHVPARIHAVLCTLCWKGA